MKKEDLFQLGIISKIHGFKGEIIFLSNGKAQINLNKLESVFIEINGQLIPFFIETINPTGDSSAIIKLNGINSEANARQLVKCNVYIPNSVLPKQKEKKLNPSELVGYKVIDDAYGDIGEIISLMEMPQQIILEIKNGRKEILIPANKEIIYNIDKKNKTIFINAPIGLIDIYLDTKD
jgi:16S rRNA processing protein RimM